VNVLDFILIIPLLFGAWRAFNKGFIMALFTILALLIGLYAAFHFSDKVSHFISPQTDSMPKYLPAFSFLILLLLVGASIYFGGKALEQVIKIAQLSLVNKLLGAALGLIKWAYFVGSILIFIDAVDLKQQFLSKELKNKSIIYPIVNGLIRQTIPDVGDIKLFKLRNAEQKK
jgi:membrane protein required for colicin V production